MPNITTSVDVEGRDTSWMGSGNCIGMSPDLFFSDDQANLAPAKAVCRGCVVRDQCLDWAMTVPERFGCWGGTSPHERTKLRREFKGRPFDAGQAVEIVDRWQTPRHGTHAGYMRHHRAGEMACPACLEGERSYRRTQVSEWRRHA